MPKGKPIDVQAVHQGFWDQSDRLGRLTIHQRDTAVELGVTHFAVCRLVERMLTEGRIKRIGSATRNVGRYLIRDPDNF